MNGSESMQEASDILRDLEPFFQTAQLGEVLTGCGDDRPIVSAELHIGAFGGLAANIANTNMVLQEANEPGSVKTTFADATEAMVAPLEQQGISVTVHSDQKTEQGNEFDPTEDNSNDVGCAYLKLRQVISKSAAENGGKAIEILVRERPNSYDNDAGQARLRKMVEANIRLGERDELYTSGREVAEKAVEKGASPIVVEGDHEKKAHGIINEKPSTALKTKSARDNGLPAYSHNSWAALEAFEKIESDSSYNIEDFLAANRLDAVLTLLALGVPAEDIKIRG
jgi:curved DNA-binding protein CbpA